MEGQNIKDTASLAFLGDALYELHVRHKLISGRHRGADMLHREAVRYVRAENQAFAMKHMLEEITPQEMEIVKRARNKKITTKPKNADPLQYKWATAFEALLGYLYLNGQLERMREVADLAIEITENQNDKKE